MRGVGVQNPKLLMFSGYLPTGKQAEMESRLHFHSDRTLKTKVHGECNEIEILEAHVISTVKYTCMRSWLLNNM